MKKKSLIIIVVSVVVLVIALVVGVLIYNKTMKEKRYNEFEKAVETYYDRHMANIKGIDKAEITLKMINNIVEHSKEKYEVESLKKCNEDSKAILSITNGKIKDIKISLNCK